MHDLVRHLEAEQIPPTRLTVDGLVRGGRRKQHRRRLVKAAAVATIVPLGLGVNAMRLPPPDPVTNAFPESCAGEVLPVPEGHWVGVSDADPTGRYIVGSLTTGARTEINNTRLAIWQDGALSIVDPPGDTISRVVVDPDGVVAGAGLAASDPQISPAWVYKDGQFTTLTGPGSLAVAGITSSGGVLGHAHGPVIWHGGGGTPQRLPDRTGSRTTLAADIDDDGTVVGAGLNAATFTPLVWPGDGTAPQQLPVPEGMDPDARAIAVRGGYAIGISGATPDMLADRPVGSGVVWNLRSGNASPLTGGLARATDVNGTGWLAGFTADGEGAISDGRERLTKLALPAQMATAGWHEGSTRVTISDDGRVVTAGPSIHGVRDSTAVVRWICS